MAKVVEEEAARATSIVKKETTFEPATNEKPASNETANHSYAEATFIVEKETALEFISKKKPANNEAIATTARTLKLVVAGTAPTLRTAPRF